GGGGGVVRRPGPSCRAVGPPPRGPRRAILLPPGGRGFAHPLARGRGAGPRLVLICGRYEGVDERVVEGLPAEEVSIGDFVLSGGELPALVVLEAVSRLVPGVLGNEESLGPEAFETGLLDHPPYTRAAVDRAIDGLH